MPPARFFEDDGMDFAVRCVLTGVRYATAEVGEVFATIERIADGDGESWVQEWLALGRRVRALGDRCDREGHHLSAWGAYLRAANYLACGNFWVPTSTEPDHYDGIWHEHRDAWDRAVANWPTPATAFELPYLDTTLPAWWFAPGGPPHQAPCPVVVLVNGIDTPASDLVMTGLADATARGYGVLTVDGPGQGRSFVDRGLALTPDWASVVAPMLDWLEHEPTADETRTCVMGINHGSLLAARAGAHLTGRVAALVLDPGVLRLDAVDVEPVHEPQRPTALDSYVLSDSDIAGLQFPVYIADAEAAMGFVGQPAELARRLDTQGTAVCHDRFTTAEGAGLDCEIGGPQIRNQRVFDWLDDHLRRPAL